MDHTYRTRRCFLGKHHNMHLAVFSYLKKRWKFYFRSLLTVILILIFYFRSLFTMTLLASSRMALKTLFSKKVPLHNVLSEESILKNGTEATDVVLLYTSGAGSSTKGEKSECLLSGGSSGSPSPSPSPPPILLVTQDTSIQLRLRQDPI